jgi:uncharacterized protein YceK
MICRIRTLFFSLFLILCVALSAGCTSVRTADTHNTTTAVQSYNAWAGKQQATDQTARSTIALIAMHVSTYNTEIAKNTPDLTELRGNLVLDQQGLDQWGSNLNALSAATDQFEKETSSLTYDNASTVQTRATLGQMTQFMRIYGIDRENARQHLLEYVSNAKAYITPDDPDYWNDNLRQGAVQAKGQAQDALTGGDAALGNLTQAAVQLEKLQ